MLKQTGEQKNLKKPEKKLVYYSENENELKTRIRNRKNTKNKNERK